MMYLILEKTPFPGIFQPMPICYLQEAEYGIGGIRFYHQGATRIQSQRSGDELYLYTFERAQQIIKYAERERPHTQHMLITPFPRSPHG